MLPADPFAFFERLPDGKWKYRALDILLSKMIPFNRGLGFQIRELSVDRVRVFSPARRQRKNHIGGAHACALALLGEYPAGLLIVQKYPFQEFRPILTDLRVSYHKQGRGGLTALSCRPENWPDLTSGEASLEMTTRITNATDELVSECSTTWQIKKWDQVRTKRI